MQRTSFPWRAIAAGAILSLLVALYSAYAGLKMGGVYWPMVTTAVVSLAIVRFLGWESKNEANVMQTAASTGGLLAAGVIFTIPAIFMLGFSVSAQDIMLVSLTGGMLGLIFVYPLRQRMVVEEKLPYADGAAAAAIITAGDKGGKQSGIMLASVGAGALLAGAKQASSAASSLLGAFTFIPYAGGFLIGPRFTAAWFAGAFATIFLLAPLSLSGEAGPIGVGIVIGAAVAYFIVAGVPVLFKMAAYYRKTRLGSVGGILLAVICIILVYAFDLSLPLALLAIIGAFLMAFVGARITGEMNVDPMEIFALILLIAAKFLFGFGVLQLVLLAAVVCIAAGIAGDAMQDFKTGHLLGTKPEHQLAAEAAGVISASLVMGVMMVSFAGIGFGGDFFPAPQAVAVKGIVGAAELPLGILAGAALGFAFTVIAWKSGLGAVAIAFGIGMYVPFGLSLPMFIGGIARLFIDRAKQTDRWRLVAGGAIAGEGLVGAAIVIFAAAKVFGF